MPDAKDMVADVARAERWTTAEFVAQATFELGTRPEEQTALPLDAAIGKGSLVGQGSGPYLASSSRIFPGLNTRQAPCDYVRARS